MGAFAVQGAPCDLWYLDPFLCSLGLLKSVLPKEKTSKFLGHPQDSRNYTLGVYRGRDGLVVEISVMDLRKTMKMKHPDGRFHGHGYAIS